MIWVHRLSKPFIDGASLRDYCCNTLPMRNQVGKLFRADMKTRNIWAKDFLKLVVEMFLEWSGRVFSLLDIKVKLRLNRRCISRYFPPTSQFCILSKAKYMLYISVCLSVVLFELNTLDFLCLEFQPSCIQPPPHRPNKPVSGTCSTCIFHQRINLFRHPIMLDNHLKPWA